MSTLAHGGTDGGRKGAEALNRVPVLVATVSGLLIVVLLVGTWLVVGGFLGGFSFLSGACSEEERNLYAEFPQFGNVRKEPEPFSETGGCAAFYDTQAPQERVAQYYMEQLRAHGWKVEQETSEATLEESGRTARSIDIMARRNGYYYEVLFESHELYDPPRPGADVAVHVFE